MKYSEGPPEPIAALNKIVHVENHEPLVDLRVAVPDLRVLGEFAVPWARAGVAAKFAAARASIAPYGIGLREAWRSPARQKFLYDHYFNGLPNSMSLATRRRMANRFFAPYDQKAPPGHSTGAALDVWLLDESGEPIPLHGKGKRFGSAPTFSADIPDEIRQKRLLLFTAMTGAGFTNCRDEWWHYSYGDAGWAVRVGSKTCVYGAVEPEPEAYVETDKKFVKHFLEAPPF